MARVYGQWRNNGGQSSGEIVMKKLLLLGVNGTGFDDADALLPELRLDLFKETKVLVVHKPMDFLGYVLPDLCGGQPIRV